MTRRQRLVRDYEQPIDVSKAMIHGALGNPLPRRIDHPSEILNRLLEPVAVAAMSSDRKFGTAGLACSLAAQLSACSITRDPRGIPLQRKQVLRSNGKPEDTAAANIKSVGKLETVLLYAVKFTRAYAFPGSSAVEQPAVNRLVAGSNPARGAIFKGLARRSSALLL